MANCNSYLHLVRCPRSKVGQVGFFRVRPSYFLREIPAGADFVNVHFVSDGAVNNFVAGHNSDTILTVEAPSERDHRIVTILIESFLPDEGCCLPNPVHGNFLQFSNNTVFDDGAGCPNEACK